jgi:hypothetical protein
MVVETVKKENDGITQSNITFYSIGGFFITAIIISILFKKSIAEENNTSSGSSDQGGGSEIFKTFYALVIIGFIIYTISSNSGEMISISNMNIDKGMIVFMFIIFITMMFVN